MYMSFEGFPMNGHVCDNFAIGWTFSLSLAPYGLSMNVDATLSSDIIADEVPSLE
jgi:hypothetical protein